MDAAIFVKQRQRVSSRREKRWSMNSQRLEEIVAELMKPISDARRSFDTDLSALLEEYLTEAGLHALEQEDSDSGSGSAAYVVPNFAELALLLQQSANIYGRKVDCLHARVLSVCDALQAASEANNSRLEEAGEAEEAEEAEAAAGFARRRRGEAAGGAGFAAVALAASPGAAREPGGARPPPTLPRQFAELQPRAAAGRPPLADLAGDHIGFPADYYVLCRLQGGMLLEELEELEQASAELESAPALLELQAALAARGPSGPGPPPTPDRPATPGPPASPSPPATPGPPPTPGSPPPVPRATSSPLPPPTPAAALFDSLKKARKRPSDERTENLAGTTIKMMIMKAASQLALVSPRRELEPPRWSCLVAARARRILQLRRRRAAREREFKGFDFALPEDIGGFAGWPAAAGCSSLVAAAAGAGAAGGCGGCGGSESDDDGFFELSSVGESDASRQSAESAEWRSGARGARSGVRELAARVLARLSGRGAPLRAVLSAALHHADVSGLFLATLFLANSGNVEIIPGAPLCMESCSLRLLSADPALYSAASLAGVRAPPPPPAPPL